MGHYTSVGGSISVVITCHDLGRTLGEALESAQRQTRPAAEIVVVDDGSRDVYTRQVLARLEREGTRVAGVTPEALDRLFGHPWPGNVRELDRKSTCLNSSHRL